MNSSFVVLLLRDNRYEFFFCCSFVERDNRYQFFFCCVCKKKRGTIDMNSSFVVYVRRREGQ